MDFLGICDCMAPHDCGAEGEVPKADATAVRVRLDSVGREVAEYGRTVEWALPTRHGQIICSKGDGENDASRHSRRPLHRGLPVVLRPEAGNPTETPQLSLRQELIGRLSVDVDIDPTVANRGRYRAYSLPSASWSLGLMRAARLPTLCFAISRSR